MTTAGQFSARVVLGDSKVHQEVVGHQIQQTAVADESIGAAVEAVQQVGVGLVRCRGRRGGLTMTAGVMLTGAHWVGRRATVGAPPINLRSTSSTTGAGTS